ncbi:hypothetical protein A8144_02285 [Mycobacterium leprae 3125609]|uniref:PPE family protein n=1 Tax=Mycobacterium leprae TaxID=1769 RepID=UPI0007DB0710|nr:PPE family protein [Mycobacterium leprae]OAR20472.1 hypothetical protein A8144_02285 [Mycobacterium leprae 3125609]OAX72067.1 hypothetical protein A3216_02510 [Mycobacterium leprae 7935681]
MSATVWMTSPPAVHSVSLSSGAGPGLLLATAAAWSKLNTAYSPFAADPNAFLAVSVPGYPAQAAVGLTTQHEKTASAVCTSAVAVMPMLVELAVNRIIRGVLVSAKFFGVNAIPIALNDADYPRMWVQATATMATYQVAIVAVLASAPRIISASVVLNPGVGEVVSATANDPVSWIWQLPQARWNAYMNLSLWIYQDIYEFLKNLIAKTVAIIEAFLTNSEAALVTYVLLLSAVVYQLFFNAIGWTTWALILSSPFTVPLASSLGLFASLAWLPTQIAVFADPAVGAAPPVVAAAAGQFMWLATSWRLAEYVCSTGYFWMPISELCSIATQWCPARVLGRSDLPGPYTKKPA